MSGKYVARLPRSMPADQARALSDVFQDLSRDATQFQLAADGAVARSTADKLGEVVSVADFGAVGDGVTDDTAAIVAAANSGREVHFRHNATYLMSAGAPVASGTALRCPGGIANIKFKTGAGGFNVTAMDGTRTTTDRCAFPVISQDNVVFEGLHFFPDGVAARVIYPIRVAAGMATHGVKFRRLSFTGFHIGAMIAVASVGDGAWDFDRLYAWNCGTSVTTWTGSGNAQWTLFEIDNDLVGGIHSQPGRGTMIGCKNCLHTGAALTLYGQQTDLLNIAGISGAVDRKGPTIYGVIADGVGEGIDLFGSGAVIQGVRLRNCHVYGVKLIHGAQGNVIDADYIENSGFAAVGLFGSSDTAAHTRYNSVRVGTIRNVGQGLSFATGHAVLFGGGALGLAKDNTVRVDNVVEENGRMVTVVQDGTAAASNNNLVEIGRASGYTRFSDATPGNVRVRVRDSTRVRMTCSASQTLTSGVNAVVQFNTVQVDANGEADTVNNRVRCKTPGPKLVTVKIRMGGQNSGDDFYIFLEKNGVTIARSDEEATSGTLFRVYRLTKIVYIDEDEAGTAAADLRVTATHTGAATADIQNTATMTDFEVIDLA